jgi:hypothetical protein
MTLLHTVPFCRPKINVMIGGIVGLLYTAIGK